MALIETKTLKPASDKSKVERDWRDSELARTDSIVPVTDRPDHAAYIDYRQALRDYPSQPGFPDIDRPTLKNA